MQGNQNTKYYSFINILPFNKAYYATEYDIKLEIAAFVERMRALIPSKCIANSLQAMFNCFQATFQFNKTGSNCFQATSNFKQGGYNSLQAMFSFKNRESKSYQTRLNC